MAGPGWRAEWTLLFVVCSTVLLAPGSRAAGIEPAYVATPVQRLRWANDFYFGTDNQYTNGLAYQQFSALSPSLEETGGTPAFGRVLARRVLPRDSGRFYREGWTIAHKMQTPDQITNGDLIPADVPFFGMLGWGNSYFAFDDRRFDGFELLLGWVGSATGGEALQTVGHAVSGARAPKGWGNQLNNEPVFNVFYAHKRKLFTGRRFDATLALDGALGTWFTFGQAGFEMRFGRIPGGFAYSAAPLGKGMQYDAVLREEGRRYLYGSMGLAMTRLLHAMPRHGNVLRRDDAWTRDNTVDDEQWLGKLAIGLHYERARWGLHLNVWLSTNALDPESVVERQDPQNNFGSVTLERRF